jgi:hypothetical protein
MPITPMEADSRGTPLTPIYSSYLTLGTFLDWLKGMPVMPSQIDRSLWSTKFSGTGGAQLVAGLRFLRLLEEDRPTATLTELVEADPADRKELLRRVLRTAYGDQFLNSLPSMTPKVFDEQLRALGTTDSTHRKAASFLINAAKAVDIGLPGAIAKKARNRPSNSTRRVTRQRQKPSAAAEAALLIETPKTHATGGKHHRTVALRGGGGEVTLAVTVDLLSLRGPDREFVFGLIDQLDSYEAGKDE